MGFLDVASPAAGDAAGADGASAPVARWPEMPAGGRVVFLLDAASPLERRCLESWIDRHRPSEIGAGQVDLVSIPASRSRGGKLDGKLEAILAEGGDPVLAPLRVAWIPPEIDGVPKLGLRDFLTLSDPRDPGRLRQWWIARRHPDRLRVVAGDPAPASALRTRWHRAGGAFAAETTGLAEFVARQATIALERAERRLRGTRYKVPRLVDAAVLGRPAFRGGLARLARDLGRTEEQVAQEAARYLREIAATHSPFVIDLVAHAIHAVYTLGYGERLHYDHDRLREIYSIAQRHPVVFLPSHKSNLDHLVLQYALHENGHPPNHTAGGINMNFFPVGPLVRRSGVFFIRRSFKDNEVYKFVLRHYIDYLIEKRFSLEWYVEGGRSRSGKLLPPRFGLLAYVVDAYLRGKSEDVVLIPVSIIYDQIPEAAEYAAEQRGATKTAESFGWFVGVLRRLKRRYGDIHIRFGEPLSVRSALGAPDPAAEPNPDEKNLALQKLAFNVCTRINRATPITPTSLVALALLGVGDRALSLEEVVSALRNLVDWVEGRELPLSEPLDLRRPEGVARVLEHLVENGVVTCFDEGPEAVWAIGKDQHLAAAYYRNSVVHFFVDAAIVELALVAAAEAEGESAADLFWTEVLAWRDLLKFEFFFAGRDDFLRSIRAEMDAQSSGWEEALAAGGPRVRALLHAHKPYNAHRVIRPFIEAYQVVGDALVRTPLDQPVDEARFVGRCLSLGRQYLLQRRITRAESVSKPLFFTALKLAHNRGLLGEGGEDLAQRRRAFADALRDGVRRVEVIDVLAAGRRTGVAVASAPSLDASAARAVEQGS